MRVRLLVGVVLLLSGCSRQEPKSAPAPTPVKILMFYTNVAEAPRGESVLFCYGVQGAASVRLDPPIEQITPSLNRCFQFAPEKTANYTLTATSRDGREVSETITVAVGPGKQQPSLIGRFDASPTTIAPGEHATICFEAAAASEVSLSPRDRFPGGKMGCFSVQPAATTTYTMRASGSGGQSSRSLTIRVAP